MRGRMILSGVPEKPLTQLWITYGLRRIDLADILMISRVTASKRWTNPETFRISELLTIAKKAKIPMEEIKTRI